ncbi:MAG: site-2 protease family protein [bacterium]|nr:site-2 protease family protein [bacterium]
MSQLFIWLLLLPPLVLSLTMHEYAHARIAYLLGDPTAAQRGRLTMNPLKHIDWLGLFLLFVIKFGWAKPVPVNPNYFNNPRRDMLWVALAGPATNLTISLVCAVWLRLVGFDGGANDLIQAVVEYTMVVNVYLAIFNLLPIPPLDGSRILTGLLPERLAVAYASLERYALFLIAGLFLYIQFVDQKIVHQLVGPFTNLIYSVAGG